MSARRRRSAPWVVRAVLGRVRAGSEQIVIRLLDVDGAELIDIRRFRFDADGDLHPTRKGVTFSTLGLPALIAALEDASACSAQRQDDVPDAHPTDPTLN